MCYGNFIPIKKCRKINAIMRRKKKIIMTESKNENEKEEKGMEERQNKPDSIQIKNTRFYILLTSVRTILGIIVASPSFRDNG